jgi:hypothetical protein
LADLLRLTSLKATSKGIKMLEGLIPPVKIRTCKVRTMIESLEAKDAQLLKEAIANKGWTHVGLAQELTKRGLSISDQSLRVHRIGRCTCAR